jgi:hypothetical protein
MMASFVQAGIREATKFLELPAEASESDPVASLIASSEVSLHQKAKTKTKTKVASVGARKPAFATTLEDSDIESDDKPFRPCLSADMVEIKQVLINKMLAGKPAQVILPVMPV